jgi:hypothetical protein
MRDFRRHDSNPVKPPGPMRYAESVSSWYDQTDDKRGTEQALIRRATRPCLLRDASEPQTTVLVLHNAQKLVVMVVSYGGGVLGGGIEAPTCIVSQRVNPWAVRQCP